MTYYLILGALVVFTLAQLVTVVWLMLDINADIDRINETVSEINEAFDDLH